MNYIKFQKQDYIQDILNSEGPLLSIVESIPDDLNNERLYLKAKIGFGKSVYCRVNETALNFFISGRISVKELFLLRNDEPYLYEKKNESNLYQQLYWLTDDFEKEILNKLPFYNLSYFSIPESARINLPYENIMKKLNLYYINSIGVISDNKLYQSGDETL
jgi:hypothetical protein